LGFVSIEDFDKNTQEKITTKNNHSDR
jgi:hypothetical protein